MRKTNSTGAEVGTDLFVLRVIKTIFSEEVLQVLRRLALFAAGREKAIEKNLNHAADFGTGTAGGAKALEFSTANLRELTRVGAKQTGDDH